MNPDMVVRCWSQAILAAMLEVLIIRIVLFAARRLVVGFYLLGMRAAGGQQ